MTHGHQARQTLHALGRIAFRPAGDFVTAKVIDGKAIAKKIRAVQAERVERLRVKT